MLVQKGTKLYNLYSPSGKRVKRGLLTDKSTCHRCGKTFSEKDKIHMTKKYRYHDDCWESMFI